ncbi:MAG TPA: hypothetical protein DEH22_07745 [Chloroflexi bacterium]|nr:hypothetical protein [Chloroflexota bacterium]
MTSFSDKIQGRLLTLAALFMGLFALALTLAPAARARSWQTDYRWDHWLGYFVWLGGFWMLHRASRHWLPQRDAYLLPLIAALSGWGLLTIWRLTPYYGLRQTIWLALGLIIFNLGLRLPPDLKFLQRYKYIWLTGGLLLTALTLIFGTNPMGYGPRMWLGCCGVYLQPSEPLKLLLIVFLAAYFANWQGLLAASHKLQAASGKPQVTSHRLPNASHKRTVAKGEALPTTHSTLLATLQVLIPTGIMTGLALLLLVVQRDLGTASIFIFIYAVMVYLATGWRWVPLISAGVLGAAGALGYLLFDVVRLRIEAWLNPWLDPTGRSYQIVQSLLAVANGGIFGRGPGMGNPTLVPVSHSDFIFAAIAEETGLIGGLGLLLLIGFFVHRGLRIAIWAENPFKQMLAAGLTAFISAQSILIIGGNLRLLPLTGVTLPFVSYGGSSLLVSLLTGLLLLLMSAPTGDRQAQLEESQPLNLSSDRPRSAVSVPITYLSGLLLSATLLAALAAGWWGYLRGPDLLTRSDNPRRAIADREVYRGSLLARGDLILAETSGKVGALTRQYSTPGLGPITGYNHPVYGQSGLEASLDPTLRGVEGNDPWLVWWHHLVYGQPPPGLDVRLTLDPQLQALADDLLNGHSGALILLNAESGEILVMASHPGFDPNLLDENWETLIQDPRAPLINRVTQGSYPTGNLRGLPFMQAAASPEVARLSLRLPLAESNFPTESTLIEAAFAAASLSNGGLRPAARLALSYRHPEQGWLVFSPLGTLTRLLPLSEADALATANQSADLGFWQITEVPAEEDLTWYLAGTLPDSRGVPLTLALVLEEDDPALAQEIGQAVLVGEK